MKKYEVSSICNALMDIIVSADDDDITDLGLTKGIMHLVDDAQQQTVISRFNDKPATQELGGSSLNAIRTLASLGSKVAFSGTIGDDDFGRKITDRLSELGIDNHTQTLEGSATGSCFILVTPDGERTMNTNLGASVLYDHSLVSQQTIHESAIFHFCGYQWGSPNQISAIQQAVDHAKDGKTMVSFDVADPFAVNQNRQAFVEVIEKSADIVFANEEEAKMLYQGSPENAVEQITKTGSIAVIKLGARGALIGRGSERVEVSAVLTEVVDTTAAGDMFAAGFLYGILRDQSLNNAGQIAATLASDVISRVGGIVSKQTIEKIKAQTITKD